MSINPPAVSPVAADWKREENRFLCRFMAPALCIQVGFLSYHSVAPVGFVSAIVNLSPAVVLMAYLGRVLYRARKEGQFYPWGAMTDASTSSESSSAHPGYPGVAVVAGGAMVAWFSDAGAAEAWATENHFGNWLMHPCVLPHVPPFSTEHLAAARARAEELYAILDEPGTPEG